jgi:peptidyl-prolyl cis-trans isomerase D
MIASFRRLSKSKVGTVILVGIGLVIASSFVFADLSAFDVGGGGGNGGANLAKVGGEQLTERELSSELRRRLEMLQQQNPQATMADLAPAFDQLVDSMIDQIALQQFAEDNGFILSKRLIDAEIANLPGTKGLDGKFSEQAYAQFLSQQRLTDADVRRILRQEILQQMLLQPIAASVRIPVGVATPYASMLLELREGHIAPIPPEAFAAGLKPSDADLQRYYTANRNRYTIPEQRVLRLARIGSQQVANVAASDAEVAAYYNQNKATYAAKSVRVLSQVVTPNQQIANSVAAAAKASGNLQAAAQGKADAAYSSLGEQTREQLSSLAGAQGAGSVFSAAKGAIVGPVQSDFGWHVFKVEDVRDQPGKSLEQARGEIAARLTETKRKAALADLADKVQDAIDDNANFQEAAAAAGLQVTQTPLITANGASRADPSFKLPPELTQVVSQAFELQQGDDPEVIPISGTDESVLVAPAQVMPAAPAPLATIRERVAADWVRQQAGERAKAAANAIAAKVARGVPMEQAVAQAGVKLPALEPISIRRLQLSQAQGQVPAAVQMLFSLMPGKSRMVAEPTGGFAVVKLNRLIPGNATLQPSLISQVQRDFQQAAAQEYARQFLSAVRKKVGVERNSEALAEAKRRILTGS